MKSLIVGLKRRSEGEEERDIEYSAEFVPQASIYQDLDLNSPQIFLFSKELAAYRVSHGPTSVSYWGGLYIPMAVGIIH